jgi:dTDP-4-dehydrorhamnose 3,5-epimerase
MLWVAPGFAYGFYTLSAVAEFQHDCTDYYFPEYERCILWNDPVTGIEWPLREGSEPTLSQEDRDGDAFHVSDVHLMIVSRPTGNTYG